MSREPEMPYPGPRFVMEATARSLNGLLTKPEFSSTFQYIINVQSIKCFMRTDKKLTHLRQRCTRSRNTFCPVGFAVLFFATKAEHSKP